MADLGKVEYRVVPIIRYQITRHYESASGHTGGTEQKGEYDNDEVAFEVATALCKAEHERLGWGVGDERIQYPQSNDERGWRYTLGSTGHGCKKTARASGLIGTGGIA